MFLCWNATVCLDCSLSFSSNPQLTILVAADGALKFPDVRNYGDLKAVVDRLNSIPTRQIQVLIDHCNDFFSDLQSIYYICPAIYLYILFLIGPVISGHSSFMDSSRWEGHSFRREAARGLSLSEAFVWWLGLLSRVLGGHQMFLVIDDCFVLIILSKDALSLCGWLFMGCRAATLYHGRLLGLNLK